MFIFGNFTLFDWMGWDNPNTCVLSYFNSQGMGENKNLGFKIFPLQFWKHFFLEWSKFGGKTRINIGIGFFSIYWDR